MPAFALLTRWGAWIEFCAYLFENFEVIKLFMENLDNCSVEKQSFLCKLSSQNFEVKLRNVWGHRFLSYSIKALENDNLEAEEQIKILQK